MKNIAYTTSLLLALLLGGWATAANAQLAPQQTLGGNQPYLFSNQNQNTYQYQTSPNAVYNPALSAVTQAAGSIDKNSAIVSGIINGSGLSYRFEYGTTAQLGWNTNFVQGNAGQVSAVLTGLTPGTTYYFRVIANNSVRMEQGQTLSFTTLKADGTPAGDDSGSTTVTGTSGGQMSGVYGSAYNTTGGDAFATTRSVSDVTKLSVIMKGEVNPRSAYTTYYFQYGTSIALGAASMPATISGSNTFLIVAQEVSGLSPATAYYYRIVAQNSNGTSYGEILKFKTAGGSSTGTSSGTNSGATAKNSNGGYAINPTSGNQSVWASLYRTFGFARNENCVALSAKLAPGNPAAGEDATYTVAYKNICDLNLMRTTLEVNVPGNVTLKDSSAQFASANGNVVTYKLDIPATSQGTITIRVTVSESAKRGEQLPFRTALQYVDGKKATQIVPVETMAAVGGSWFSWGSSKITNSASVGASTGASVSFILLNVLLVGLLVGLVTFVIVRNRSSAGPSLRARLQVQ
jgi:hypothetical protein